ncbi:MAG: ABC transporter ATP-binding protein [Deltaproteobacteria bacterium]|jgi:NitT/TauT family transport system ATP-binding protein/taurine transport system ATP-binding protein|nr:ABC transporter ATP-binding protein [Deltaproteobacteria bacterium]
MSAGPAGAAASSGTAYGEDAPGGGASGKAAGASETATASETAGASESAGASEASAPTADRGPSEDPFSDAAAAEAAAGNAAAARYGRFERDRRGDSASPAAELAGVTLSFRRGKSRAVVLSDISLRLWDNDFACVLGPSGCGKTTLLNVLAGYSADIEGEVLIGGRPHLGPDPSVGVVFQSPNLFPWLSAADNVGFGLKMMKAPKETRRARVSELLELIGLENSASLLPHQMSGGMRQRVAIARALALDSRIVLLDEPFSALDAMTRETMQQHVRRIWKSAGRCFFFITHDIQEALLLANRLIVMSAAPGRIFADFSNPLREDPEADFESVRADPRLPGIRADVLDMIQGNSLVI